MRVYQNQNNFSRAKTKTLGLYTRTVHPSAKTVRRRHGNNLPALKLALAAMALLFLILMGSRLLAINLKI
jgi:hypothetical protein